MADGDMKCPCCSSKNIVKVSECKNIMNSSSHFGLMRCKGCAHEFISPLPSDEELKKFYDDMYDHGQLAKTPMAEQKKETLSIIKKLKTCSPRKEVKVLDLGVGNGDFFKQCQKEGFDVYGIDYSVFIKSLGLPEDKIMVGDFRGKGIENKFDVITISHVLEHLRDPESMIKAVYKALKAGGILIARVPNKGSIGSMLMRKISSKNPWYLLPPSHLHYFNSESMKKMASKCFDLKSIRIGTFPYLMMNPYALPIALLQQAIMKNNLSLERQTKQYVKRDAKQSLLNKIGLKITDVVYSMTRFLYNPISNKLKIGEDLVLIAKK